jgi:predicted Rossmann fold nucleotide-binding protein DprA/Smf involved in DNA uptake
VSDDLSPNAQAILLLTAPLIVGSAQRSAETPLSAGEYAKLAALLHAANHTPADLLASSAEELLATLQTSVDAGRLRNLLARGFQLGQAVERWRARSIWVVSRADAQYPRRLKAKLRELAPPVLYGCGQASLLDAGGLAIVGSRNADPEALQFTENVARRAASLRTAVVSGGARGIDLTAMRAALDNGGTASGVLADSLERAALAHDNRAVLVEQRLVLVSPFDPSAGFNVGNAMQRNKLVYALADAALVVAADANKGGTWAGAVEQLERLHSVRVYVRESSEGTKALLARGATRWPEPEDERAWTRALHVPPRESVVAQRDLQLDAAPPSTDARQQLFATVRAILEHLLVAPSTVSDVSRSLGLNEDQARQWLDALVADGALVRDSPTTYRTALRSVPVAVQP